MLEDKLRSNQFVEPGEIERVHNEVNHEIESALRQVLAEPKPTPEDIRRFTYAPSQVDAVYPDDYTGLPE